MCVPLWAPSEYLESVKASPLRMSFRNSKVIGASPSYTGVVDGSSVVVTSIQPVDPPPNGVEPDDEAHARANVDRAKYVPTTAVFMMSSEMSQSRRLNSSVNVRPATPIIVSATVHVLSVC